MFQQPPQNPLQHPHTPDHGYGHLTTTTLHSPSYCPLLILTFSLLSSFTHSTKIFFFPGWLVVCPRHINSLLSKYRQFTWFGVFSLFLIPAENYFPSCLVSAAPPSLLSSAEFVNLLSVLSWRSSMKHETRPTSQKSLWHFSIHNLICCFLSPPFTLFLESVFRPLDSVYIQSNLN